MQCVPKTDFIVIGDDLMTDTILCFDLGTKTGWVIYGVDGHIMSGTVNFQPRRFEDGEMRYLLFKQ
ncbi:Putative phage related protein [Bartonella henselae str. Houston-1]|uniref:Putative phage related protein n=1 Tax=Bartonella henselae (strain ATCC 49882 / DSM 28221 / CCUG 30454 / Houston 1) TaxID=283166 RepID=A0A0H3M3H1_BARHE|nr:hypothetical protein BhenCHDE101_04415 [Bartonella henselae]ETS08586.1 hypothetical protein Q655_00855 [Bartonella henselae JK 51]CAF27703.1 Putative phage related protein [Bartonella henselae str. Houston-1]OLL39011.1 hypothetical protein AT244_01630 [Bartonella henselae]OLL46586.1 hypothetical protein AT245_06215 [Bartonella henselae]